MTSLLGFSGDILTGAKLVCIPILIAIISLSYLGSQTTGQAPASRYSVEFHLELATVNSGSLTFKIRFIDMNMSNGLRTYFRTLPDTDSVYREAEGIITSIIESESLEWNYIFLYADAVSIDNLQDSDLPLSISVRGKVARFPQTILGGLDDNFRVEVRFSFPESCDLNFTATLPVFARDTDSGFSVEEDARASTWLRTSPVEWNDTNQESPPSFDMAFFVGKSVNITIEYQYMNTLTAREAIEDAKKWGADTREAEAPIARINELYADFNGRKENLDQQVSNEIMLLVNQCLDLASKARTNAIMQRAGFVVGAVVLLAMAVLILRRKRNAPKEG